MSFDREITHLCVAKQVPTYYLGGKSVHVCTQQYTHVYTTVYTRVHYLALSMSSVEGLLGRLSGLTPMCSRGANG